MEGWCEIQLVPPRPIALSVSMLDMSEPVVDWISNPLSGRDPEKLAQLEIWWAERQKTLEQAGYMLRPRYLPDWRPSWTGTDKFYLLCEDGQPQTVGVSIAFDELR